MIKARIRWCSRRVENILTLGKLLRLWFCFLLNSILFFISQTSYRTYKIISSYELARPIMGTIFLVTREGGLNFTSCSENGNGIARGAAECYFAVIATTSGIYPKISLLPVILILYLASFVKSKYLIFKLASTMSSALLLLPASHNSSV